MSADLVLRLRNHNELLTHSEDLCDEAADEIERLRAENMKLMADNTLSDAVRIKDLEIQLAGLRAGLRELREEVPRAIPWRMASIIRDLLGEEPR